MRSSQIGAQVAGGSGYSGREGMNASLLPERLRTNLDWRFSRLIHNEGLDLGRVGKRSLNARLRSPAAARAPLATDMTLIGTALSAVRSPVGFVQIGAYDGRANDPIYALVRRFGWQGVLIEPQPGPFAQLKETYADVPNLVFLQAAVDDKRGERDLWRVEDVRPGDPDWLPQVASFDPHHVLTHLGGDPANAERIVASPVELITIDDAISWCPAPVEVVQIDAEGYDLDILRAIDLEQHTPTVIQFEHGHVDHRAYDRALARLVGYGYRIAVSDGDTLAVRPL